MEHSLLSDAVQRAVVIEAKVTGVDNVVCAGVTSKLVERSKVA
jgi:hypothetical protein